MGCDFHGSFGLQVGFGNGVRLEWNSCENALCNFYQDLSKTNIFTPCQNHFLKIALRDKW